MCTLFLCQESGGSARTDYRAIQLAKKKKKQRGPSASSGKSRFVRAAPSDQMDTGATAQQQLTMLFLIHPGQSSGQRKTKGTKAAVASAPLAPSGARFGEGAAGGNGGLTLRDPVTGAQYVQIQLLQVRSPMSGYRAVLFPTGPVHVRRCDVRR